MTRTPLRGTPLRTLLISLLAVFGLVLTACSSDDGGGDGSGDGSGDTITIEHAFGTTEIDGTPERVATVQFENQEVPLALGVVPVGMAKANFGGSDVLPWVQEQLDELGVSGDDEPVLFDESDGIDFEAVSDTAPDVILAGYSGLEQEDYDKLSEIAPTIPFPKDQVAWGTPWRENIEIESKAIGKEDEGKDLVTDLESQISEVSFYTSHDTRPMFFEDLGMEAPDSIKKFSDENDSFSGTISTEQADVFDDVDIIVTYGDQELLDAMKDNPVLGQIPAIKNDAVVLLENDELGTAAMPTPLGIPYILDDYVKVLSDAATKSES